MTGTQAPPAWLERQGPVPPGLLARGGARTCVLAAGRRGAPAYFTLAQPGLLPAVPG